MSVSGGRSSGVSEKSLRFERTWREKTGTNQFGRAAVQRIDQLFEFRINNVRTGLMQPSNRAISGRYADAKQSGLTGSPRCMNCGGTGVCPTCRGSGEINKEQKSSQD